VVAAIVALRAATAARVLPDCVPADLALTDRGSVCAPEAAFACASGFVFRDFPGFVVAEFTRGAARAAAGFRAGLAVRVTLMDAGKLPRVGIDVDSGFASDRALILRMRTIFLPNRSHFANHALQKE
jgi:hypothetical protein